ncbi:MULTISPECIES: 5-oxoprolinase subunit PxpA [unclassified Cellulophaga]|uniref:5-oxoprolinase subunit PxpA n=1 Tax=unclassified Cellulophaga TaxID=2634405 RepID=UPI0026E14CDD|nr:MULTISPECIES: 5-oxoprolinase subunit PxpA [unclassified Cellulophaga]MDO6491052.1 5-oxoprolinase subunit PxpA [Cellulophaga sp. 2_MG-2023]MDO6493754.1 5-oxoprolinase subunit PxpA [Cellulophaga sp. 3_MG-2023]
MAVKTIDINVDVGEGVGNESQLMPFISSCNIACGGHAGTMDLMKHIVRLAKINHVKIGAHPSFPDKENFGRVAMEISNDKLLNSIQKQLLNLLTVIVEEKTVLHHIKPHGALYNLAAIDENIARVVVKAVKSIDLPVKLYVPYNSVIEKIAIKENLKIKYEAFADRNYNDDLTLVSRSQKNAVIVDFDNLFSHVYGMYTNKTVITAQGSIKKIMADTFCLHGDNPNAVEIMKQLKYKLKSLNIDVA